MRIVKLLFSAALLVGSQLTFSFTPPKNIVVFGDSLSDNGNLYEYMNHAIPASPPYFEGRFSNGPVWAEMLQKYFEERGQKIHLLDYAFGGAAIAEGPEDDELYFTLRREINTYLLAHDDKADADNLYVVWIGANNYLGLEPESDEASLDTTVDAVVRGIRHGLGKLAKAGAKNVLVINLPDLSQTPLSKMFDMAGLFRSVSDKHNQALAETIDRVKAKYPEVNWYAYDVGIVFDKLINDPAAYGITNFSDTCYESVIPEPQGARTMLQVAAKIQPKKKHDACDGFLFFDPVHPTKIAHQAFAQDILQFLLEKAA